MKNSIIANSVIAFFLLGNVAFAVEDGDGVIERHTGSTNLPDSVAYQVFNGFVVAYYAKPESAYQYVAKAMGLDIDTTVGRSRAAALTDQQRDMSIQMEIQNAQETFAVLCPEDQDSRSFDEVADALNIADDIRAEMQTQYLQLTLDSLNDKELASFQAFLEKTKPGISFTRIDSGAHYQSHPDRNIWDDVRQSCQQLAVVIEAGE